MRKKSDVEPFSTITCAWCRKAIAAGRHARLARAASIGASAATRAYFHVPCAEAIMRLCEERQLQTTPAKPVEMTVQAIERWPASAPKPTPRSLPPRAEIKPKPRPESTASNTAVPDETRAKIRELAARRFTPNMIAAQLRVPYAAVAVALGDA